MPGSEVQAGSDAADVELERAIADTLAQMRTATGQQSVELGRRLVELLDRRNAVHAARAAELDTLASRMERAVHALDDASSSAELMRRACEQVADLCSAHAVVLSRLDGDRIVPVSSFRADPDTTPSLPDEFTVTAGSTEALVLESHSAVTAGKVPPHLQQMLGTGGLTAVPVVIDGEPAAFVHVAGQPTPTQLDALAVFADVLGGCFERIGLEIRRERQDALLHESANRWSSSPLAAIQPPQQSTPSGPAGSGTDEAQWHLVEPLTDREADVVRLILTGASNAGIAAELVITVDTVKSHVKRILRKLGATNRAELIAKYRSAAL